jgi:hypothetical protein
MSNRAMSASEPPRGGIGFPPDPLGQKIEAIGGIVPARHSLVGRCAATGLMQQRIADLAIFVLGCCELHSQKQAQLKVGAFQPQPSGYKN